MLPKTLQDNEIVEMLTKEVNSLLRGTRKGQVAVCLCLVSCGFGMSRESSDTVGQICITVCEQCPLMAIHSDC